MLPVIIVRPGGRAEGGRDAETILRAFGLRKPSWLARALEIKRYHIVIHLPPNPKRPSVRILSNDDNVVRETEGVLEIQCDDPGALKWLLVGLRDTASRWWGTECETTVYDGRQGSVSDRTVGDVVHELDDHLPASDSSRAV